MAFCSDFRVWRVARFCFAYYDRSSIVAYFLFLRPCTPTRMMPFRFNRARRFTGPLWSFQCGCHAYVDTRLSLHCASHKTWVIDLNSRMEEVGSQGDYETLISKYWMNSRWVSIGERSTHVIKAGGGCLFGNPIEGVAKSVSPPELMSSRLEVVCLSAYDKRSPGDFFSIFHRGFRKGAGSQRKQECVVFGSCQAPRVGLHKLKSWKSLLVGGFGVFYEVFPHIRTVTRSQETLEKRHAHCWLLL